jgi:hypothetical protein
MRGDVDTDEIGADPDGDPGRKSPSDPVLLLLAPETSEEPSELLDALF